MNFTKFQKWAGIVLLSVFIPFAAWAILIDSNGTNQSVKTPFTVLSPNNVSDFHIKGDSGTGGLDVVLESTPAGLTLTIPGGGTFFISKLRASGDIVSTGGKFAGDGGGLSNLLATVTQVFNNFYTTNQYVDIINSLSNAFITINQDIKVTGKATFNQLIITNGFSPGFKTLVSSSQGTNFILDGASATYFTIFATNDVYVQRITNTTPNAGISGAAVSVRIFPNGADRNVYVPTNWVNLETNIWDINTALGCYHTVVTNSANLNGPRNLLLSALNFDSSFNPTNTDFLAKMSP